MRFREWDELVKRHGLARLQEHAGLPVTVHKAWIVVGEVGWLAHVIGFELLSTIENRKVSNYGKVVSLYTLSRGIGDIHKILGGDHLGRRSYVEVPEDHREAGPAMEALIDRMIVEGLPLLARYPDLASVAERLRWVLANEPDSMDRHRHERLAYTAVLLGEYDEALSSIERLIRIIDSCPREYYSEWDHAQKQRAQEIADLVTSSPSMAIARLAELARESAKEQRLPPPQLPV